ncbi:MAG: hypothetical protein HY905_18425 [Deltaproteobacteria bacterium]|nr:hypothetical protein [Deltaproteobacteria bacterium]
MAGKRRGGARANGIASCAAIAVLVVALPAQARAQEPGSPPYPEAVASEPSVDEAMLAIPTTIRIESPQEGLPLRLWAVAPPGPYPELVWSDNVRSLCSTPCTLVLPQGTYLLDIDHDYDFDVVAQDDPLLLHVTPTNQTLWGAGVWMLIAGSIQFGAALLADLMLALFDSMAWEMSDPGAEDDPSLGDRLVGGSGGVGAVFFGISMVGLGVALTGAGLMIGALGSVDELPDDHWPEWYGEVFYHQVGTPFFPPTTSQK